MTGSGASGLQVIVLYIAALWVPGLLLGLVGGMRGWTLAAAAPLLTYAVAGVAGPAFSALGVPWSPATAAVLVGVLAAGAALRRSMTRRTGAVVARTSPPWTLSADSRVAAAVAAIAVFGIGVVWTGVGRLSAVPQDWDAAFHANGIRWIAETGDSSLVGMGEVNWFEDGVQVFYPNAYHLVAAAVLRLSGADVPTVLNAHTALLPGMGALVVVALVRRYRGPPALAIGAAACSVAISAFYDMLWRGPLLPFATGVALAPMAVVLLLDVLDAEGLSSRIGSGLLFALGMAGLISLNPAMLFTAALFALPAMVQRWSGWPRLLRREPLTILAAGGLAAVLVLPQLLSSLQSASGDPFDWEAVLLPPEAVGQLLTLSHGGPAQGGILVAVVIGLVRFGRLRGLRWIGVVSVVFGSMFVLAASSDEFWVNAITRPWWNDRWRFIGMCVVPVAVIAGHGLAELQRWAAGATAELARHTAGHWPRRVAPVVAAGLVTVLFLGLTDGLYAGRNVERMRLSAPDGPVVSALEVDAMRALAAVVPPEQRVLNDRGDGSVWMYAIAGVLPVAAHYGTADVGPDAALLAERFNQYPTDPAVRAAVDRLGVTHVMIGQGFVRPDHERAVGMVGLDAAEWLEVVYQNRDAVVYRIRTDVPGRS